MLAINKTFMCFPKRAESADDRSLVATFVDVGPLLTLLSSFDHQIIYGRRGTGKTHAFHYLASARRRAGDVVVYIDLRTVGSSNFLYFDPSTPLNERATRLMIDGVTAIHDQLLETVLIRDDEFNLAEFGPALDKLTESISTVPGSRRVSRTN